MAQMRSHIGRAIVTVVAVLLLVGAQVVASLVPAKVTADMPYSCPGGREITIPMNPSITEKGQAEVVATTTYEQTVSNISLVTSESNDGHRYTVKGGQILVADKVLGAFSAQWPFNANSVDPSAVAPPPNALLKLCLRP